MARSLLVGYDICLKEFAAVADEAFQEALNEGASLEKAELRAREVVLGDVQRRLGIGPESGDFYADPFAPGGLPGDVSRGLVQDAFSVNFSAVTVIQSTDASNNLTGNGVIVPGGTGKDSLLIFFEASNQGSSQDAAIIRYREGTSREDNFSDEPTVTALFEFVSDFDNANII